MNLKTIKKTKKPMKPTNKNTQVTFIYDKGLCVESTFNNKKTRKPTSKKHMV